MTSKSSAKSTGKKRRDPIPQPHGGAIIPGAGGGPQPGAGRPPDEFKRMCRELASSQNVANSVEKILRCPADYPTLYIGALKWATEHGYGRPKEFVELTGKDGRPIEVQEWKIGQKIIKF